MTRKAKLNLVVAVAAASLVAFFVFRSEPLEKVVGRKLDKIMTYSQITAPPKIFEARIIADDLAEVFTDSVGVNYNAPDVHVKREFTRREIVDGITGVLLRVQKSSAGYSRLSVKSTGPDIAFASFFLVAEFKTDDETEMAQAAEDVRLKLVREDDEWKIAGIETLER